jgi:hypothetical protein
MTTKAKRKAEIAPELQTEQIKIALRDIRNGRDLLRRCGSKAAADYVSRALKSVEGALRHSERMDVERYYSERRNLENYADRELIPAWAIMPEQ